MPGKVTLYENPMPMNDTTSTIPHTALLVSHHNWDDMIDRQLLFSSDTLVFTIYSDVN